jgi:hypothetical protein
VQEILTSDGFSKKWGGCGDEGLHAASMCQSLGADVFRTVKSWAFHESLLRKYCSGSCKNSRVFQGRNMSDRDAAMYTVVAIRRRLTSAVKDPVCACIDCNFPSCGVQLQCDVSKKSGCNLSICPDDVLHELFSKLISSSVDTCLSRITSNTVNILRNIPISGIFRLAHRQGMVKCADLMFPGGLAFFTIRHWAHYTSVHHQPPDLPILIPAGESDGLLRPCVVDFSLQWLHDTFKTGDSHWYATRLMRLKRLAVAVCKLSAQRLALL